MSRDDEARYGRTCLLALNVCPFTLRQVIDDYSLRHVGSLSLCDFLEKNKHSLFHLYAKKCCCRYLKQDRTTPMYKSQWDSLFIQNTSSCRNGKQIDCPCKYDCKSGITTKVMDITLCCLVINNICPGVDINHIKTIRDIRNKLIHAESASLDLLTYNGYWNRLGTALCQLAKNVSSTLHKGTVDLIDELENRVMDPVELRELRNLIVDENRLTDLESDVSNIAHTLRKSRIQNQREISQIRGACYGEIQMADSALQELSIVHATRRQGKEFIGEVQEQFKTIHLKTNEQNKQMEDFGRQIDDHRRHIDDHGRHIDEQGREIDDHGRQIDDQSRQIDDHGRQIDDHGKQINVHVRQIDYYGRQIDYYGRRIFDYGRLIFDHGRYIDEHGRHIDEHDREIDEHGRQIDDHSRHIDDHRTQIDDHGRQIEDYGRQIDDYGRQIFDHGRQIDDYGRQIDDYSRQIDDYGRQVLDHGRQIVDHGTQIDDHDTQIADHGRQIDEQAKQIADIKQSISYGKVPSIIDSGVSKMKERLLEINDEITRVIQLSPMQETGEELPIELLYASVVICEDQKYVTKGHSTLQHMRGCTRLGGLNTSDFCTGSYRYKSSYRREATNPDDIFTKDGKYVRTIYMLGDAAHGKTTYCIWLLRKWCNGKRKERTGQKVFDMWEKELKKFDFVFLMKFRNINDPNLVSVVEMICEDAFESERECHDAIRNVLQSDRYKSLIILDGLDEWNSHNKNRMPKIDVSGRVTCFISMRPWVFPLLLKKPQRSHMVIEILGLSETGMENVIRNVLVNHYKLKENSQKYTDMTTKILKHLENRSVKSLMQIPLLAVVCVQIWYGGKQIGDSMTSFYAEMINMLIERATVKHEIEQGYNQAENSNLPQSLSVHNNIRKLRSVLLKLGKVAYEGLISNETILVFEKSRLEKEVGVRELQCALDVGLISQKEAHSLTTKNVSVHFFHKSIQEFLAVLYIATNKEVGDSFCKQLSNIKVIMEFSNVIIFICGMYPSLGSAISQHIVKATDSDTEICQFRKSPVGGNSKVEQLYNLQVSWYRELQYGCRDKSVTFHVSDAVLCYCSDTETVRMTRKLLFDPNVDVRSLSLYQVPTGGDCGISNKELNSFLCNLHNSTRSQVMVYINGRNTDRSVHENFLPSLNTLYLYNVKIDTDLDLNDSPAVLSGNVSISVMFLWDVTLGNRGLDLSRMTSLRVLVLNDVTFVESGLDLSGMTSLCVLELWCMTLSNRGLGLSTDMAHIKKVRLCSVNMSSEQWKRFVLSVLNIQHRFNVLLENTNIDVESRTQIQRSPHLVVTQDGEKYGRYMLYFTRV